MRDWRGHQVTIFRYGDFNRPEPKGWTKHRMMGHHGESGYCILEENMGSDFLLPDGNVQISFSGGRTSAYMLHQILQANGNLPDRCQVLFANTGREMPETLDFVNDCADKWGVNVIWVEYDRLESGVSYKVTDYKNASRGGEPFKTLIKAKKYLPNVVTRFCTTELKILPMKRYLTKRLGWKSWAAAVGIRADESHRAKKESKDRWSYWYPMIDAGETKQTVNDFWRKQNFDLRLSNASGSTPKGNCDFCFLKSEAILAAMVKEHPDRAVWWSEMEQMAGSTFHKKRNFEEFVDFVQRQEDWVFNEQGYFCQADQGECTG
jgi:3'-phosphoadenosine 5'-phosphosulfate sulfotransferase (PAPS reductase)/FAD synthetase